MIIEIKIKNVIQNNNYKKLSHKFQRISIK